MYMKSSNFLAEIVPALHPQTLAVCLVRPTGLPRLRLTLRSLTDLCHSPVFTPSSVLSLSGI